LIATAILAIPEAVAVLTTATGSTDEAVDALQSFRTLLSNYVAPFIGLLNNVLLPSTKAALVTLIIWLILKPGLMWVITTVIKAMREYSIHS